MTLDLEGTVSISKRMTLVCIAALVSVFLIGATASAAKPATFNKTIDKLVADGFPQSIVTKLGGFRSSDLGYRLGGSAADVAAAKYLAAQMRAMGMKNVRLEKVPGDVWDFRGASLTLGSRVMAASIWAGAAPTPHGGLTGQIVYVGSGTTADYAAAGDVRGKIVLLDWIAKSWWMNWPQEEAALHGASAVIYTTSASDLSYYSDPDSWGSNDMMGSAAPPSIYIRRTDGDWLKEQIAAGEVSGMVRSKVLVRKAEDGGFGYNVIGKIPGTAAKGESVLFTAHHDAYFRGAVDNATGSAAALTIARALIKSKTKLQRSVTVLITTMEEFGVSDSWYDWCRGAFWAATRSHTGWIGNVAADINLEGIGCPLGQTRFWTVAELVPLLTQMCADHPKLMGSTQPNQINQYPSRSTDAWSFTAQGIPSINYMPKPPATWYAPYYHASLDTVKTVDWEFFAKGCKLVRLVHAKLDNSLLPYKLSARAAQFAGTAASTDLLAAGADTDKVTRLETAVQQFTDAATAFEEGAASLPANKLRSVSKGLLQIERVLCDQFTGLIVDSGTAYPHTAVLGDLTNVNAAIAAITADTPDKNAALDALMKVGLMKYTSSFSRPVYLMEMQRHNPAAGTRLGFGVLAQLPVPIDVWPESQLITAEQYVPAAAGLRLWRGLLISQLDERLGEASAALEQATDALKSLQ